MVPDDAPATGALPDLSRWLGRSGTVVTSPALRCRVEGATVVQALAPWDLGDWRGRSFADLDLAAWRTDPAYDAHGGESLIALHRRMTDLLATWHPRSGRIAAVTHAALIKVAVVVAMRAPIDAVWDVDIAPGSMTELHATPVGWRVVRVNAV